MTEQEQNQIIAEAARERTSLKGERRHFRNELSDTGLVRPLDLSNALANFSGVAPFKSRLGSSTDFIVFSSQLV